MHFIFDDKLITCWQQLQPYIISKGDKNILKSEAVGNDVLVEVAARIKLTKRITNLNANQGLLLPFLNILT
jgi:hypothetical protein